MSCYSVMCINIVNKDLKLDFNFMTSKPSAMGHICVICPTYCYLLYFHFPEELVAEKP
jgi:hypothetical protein